MRALSSPNQLKGWTSSQSSYRPPHQWSRSSATHAAPTSNNVTPTSSSVSSSILPFVFEQFQSLIDSSNGNQWQASPLTTTHLGLQGSYAATISPITSIFESGSSHHDLWLISSCRLYFPFLPHHYFYCKWLPHACYLYWLYSPLFVFIVVYPKCLLCSPIIFKFTFY